MKQYPELGHFCITDKTIEFVNSVIRVSFFGPFFIMKEWIEKNRPWLLQGIFDLQMVLRIRVDQPIHFDLYQSLNQFIFFQLQHLDFIHKCCSDLLMFSITSMFIDSSQPQSRRKQNSSTCNK